ncbi:GNAT family N-acetyltransferase [Marinilabilia rubra]|uniref:GNAT family N-acetyltransferase n=1 Tax=Marinilabilia rubra TaxID=2162893 RepID=A0A2U2B524_9BACT|nr:GNAT family N-acetyltransferase [Marinilabilia rubra]PWD98178.1 GNAT family N-acetyltransferase [Marinilabilia rubra]
MYQTNIFNPEKLPSEKEKNEIIDFLYTHLDQFGDPREDISKAIDYSLKISDSFGGFVLQLKDDNQTVGAVVINKTGMDGYIPGNILVYIAIHSDYRGKGLGKELMEKSLSEAAGDVALHVEPDNPAKLLYEKFGFTNKYLEMRYKPQ